MSQKRNKKPQPLAPVKTEKKVKIKVNTVPSGHPQKFCGTGAHKNLKKYKRSRLTTRDF